MFFVEKILAGFSKLKSKCTQESFEYNFYKKPCFKTNCGQLKESCSLLAGNLWQNCQNCILILNGITLIEINFFDHRVFGFIFDCWAKKNQSFLQKFSAGFLKLHSTCPKKPFEVKNIFSQKKKDFWMFWDLSEKKFGLCWGNY